MELFLSVLLTQVQNYWGSDIFIFFFILCYTYVYYVLPLLLSKVLHWLNTNCYKIATPKRVNLVKK